MIDGALDTENCTRCTAADIETYIGDALSVIDIDGSGTVSDPTALGDGVMIVRYLFGFRGNTLIDGALDTEKCTRCTATEIETYIQSLMP